MYPSFPLSGSIPSYHSQQSLNMFQQHRSHPCEDLVSLRCPRYAFQLMTGLLEVLSDSHLQDVTLVCCDGLSVRTNKLLLAAGSPYFRHVLALQGSELYLPGITSEVLNVLLMFMLRGDVQVSHRLLPYVMNAATTLQIRGFQTACAMIPSDLPGETKHHEVIDITPAGAQPTKKRKLEVDENVLECGSASLFRPWNASAVSSTETIPQTTTSFRKPTLPMSPPIFAKPSYTPRNAPSTPIVPKPRIVHTSCVSPDTSLDFSPLLASTLKGQVPPGASAIQFTSTPTTYHQQANITPSSPLSLSSSLDHTTDFASPLSGTFEISATSPMSRLNSSKYRLPGSLDQFTTPVAKTSPARPVTRMTPMELLKADPSSAAEVLCGSLPLFDDSKDDTVVEYRDESDDEGNLVIDIEEPNQQ